MLTRFDQVTGRSNVYRALVNDSSPANIQAQEFRAWCLRVYSCVIVLWFSSDFSNSSSSAQTQLHHTSLSGSFLDQSPAFPSADIQFSEFRLDHLFHRGLARQTKMKIIAFLVAFMAAAAFGAPISAPAGEKPILSLTVRRILLTMIDLMDRGVSNWPGSTHGGGYKRE